LNQRFEIAAIWFDKLARFLPNSASLKPILNQAEDFSPLGSSSPSGPATSKIYLAGEGKEES